MERNQKLKPSGEVSRLLGDRLGAIRDVRWIWRRFCNFLETEFNVNVDSLGKTYNSNLAINEAERGFGERRFNIL
jgi:hypothetical protein